MKNGPPSRRVPSQICSGHDVSLRCPLSLQGEEIGKLAVTQYKQVLQYTKRTKKTKLKELYFAKGNGQQAYHRGQPKVCRDTNATQPPKELKIKI